MRLNFKKYGESGKVICIIHGIFGSLDNWHTVAKELSKEYIVYTLDMRNHGYSPHSDEMSVELMAKDIQLFFEEQGLSKVHLLGHSMGGKVAMYFADKFHQYLASLIVVDIAPKDYKAGHHPYFRAYEEIDLSSVKNRKELDQAFSEYESNLGVRQFLMKNIVNKEGGYHLKINVSGIKKGYDEIIAGLDLGKIEVPTLFVAGANSNYITEEDRPTIESHFQNVDFVSIPNTGHWVHAENRSAFVQRVMEFLK